MIPLILVVETDTGTSKLLGVLLERQGFDVDVVTTMAQARALLEHVRYGAVILGLQLGDGSAFELLDFIRGTTPDLLDRAIVLSSSAPAHLQQARATFGVRALRKPFEIDELIDTVKYLADRTAHAPSFDEVFTRDSVTRGAKAGIIVRLDHSRVSIVTTFGYQPGEAERYFPAPLSADYPVCAAMRNRTPVWLASIQGAGHDYPLLVPIFKTYESHAIAAVPLLQGEEVIGAVGWSFGDSRRFDSGERRMFERLADEIARRFDPHAPTHSNLRAGA
ncbi:MAG TPA: GAF domain-containing protein [Thermoanaerobaculia bacterium]